MLTLTLNPQLYTVEYGLNIWICLQVNWVPSINPNPNTKYIGLSKEQNIWVYMLVHVVTRIPSERIGTHVQDMCVKTNAHTRMWGRVEIEKCLGF